MTKPQHRTTRRVHVPLDDRHFYGHYDGDKLIAIKERRLFAPGSWLECWYDAPIWHHNTKSKPRKGGLTFRILEALGET